MGHRKMVRWNAIAVFVALASIVFAAPVLATAHTRPTILPREARPYGLTYGEWSAKWWQWVYFFPYENNPVLDPDGRYMALGQSGPVWFLAGTFGPSFPSLPTVRTGTIPADTALFFPIYNTYWDNSNYGMGMDEETWETTPFNPSDLSGGRPTVAQMRALMKGWVDPIKGMSCEIDGVPVQGVDDAATSPYRAQSPGFGLEVPDHAVWKLLYPYPPVLSEGPRFIGCSENPGEAAISDGVWLMLAPLSVGKHTIHFKVGTFLDVTYNLTVTPAWEK